MQGSSKLSKHWSLSVVWDWLLSSGLQPSDLIKDILQHYNWRAALCYYRFNSAHSFLQHIFEGRRSIFLNSSLNLTESISGSEAIRQLKSSLSCLTSWRTGSLQQFTVNEIINSAESRTSRILVLEFPDFKLSPKYGYAPSGQFRRFGLTFNEINTSRTWRLLYPSGER